MAFIYYILYIDENTRAREDEDTSMFLMIICILSRLKKIVI